MSNYTSLFNTDNITYSYPNPDADLAIFCQKKRTKLCPLSYVFLQKTMIKSPIPARTMTNANRAPMSAHAYWQFRLYRLCNELHVWRYKYWFGLNMQQV